MPLPVNLIEKFRNRFPEYRKIPKPFSSLAVAAAASYFRAAGSGQWCDSVDLHHTVPAIDGWCSLTKLTCTF
jgi:hypothetical protein